jgi:hypothetical protein
LEKIAMKKLILIHYKNIPLTIYRYGKDILVLKKVHKEKLILIPNKNITLTISGRQITSTC